MAHRVEITRRVSDLIAAQVDSEYVRDEVRVRLRELATAAGELLAPWGGRMRNLFYYRFEIADVVGDGEMLAFTFTACYSRDRSAVRVIAAEVSIPD